MTVPHPNYITPEGFAKLRAEYDHLLGVERPRIVEVVSWAAGNGDRSENGDYLYGRKRMREIDGQLKRLSKKMKDAKVVDPRQQPDRSRVYFGATVTIVDEDDASRTLTIVGNDETDVDAGRILEGRSGLDEVGSEIRDLVVSLGQGGRTKSEELGHQEFILTYKSFEPLGPACLPAA